PWQLGRCSQSKLLSRVGQPEEAARGRSTVMGHLRPDQFSDCSEGVETESARSHLLSCSACRAQVEVLRAAVAAARNVDVPEPSPLFWDRFSTRVHEAVQAEATRSTKRTWWVPGRLVWAGSATLILLSVWIGFRGNWSSERTSSTGALSAEREEPSGEPTAV